jgi:hypothetical protein
MPKIRLNRSLPRASRRPDAFFDARRQFEAHGLVLWQVALHQYVVRYGSDVLHEARSLQQALQWLAHRPRV